MIRAEVQCPVKHTTSMAKDCLGIGGRSPVTKPLRLGHHRKQRLLIDGILALYLLAILSCVSMDDKES